MRLWHEDLIPHLPRQQLLGQHRECCALRGLGWGRSHSTVNYVFRHPRIALVAYHMRVMDEMERRGYDYNPLWRNWKYRGMACSPDVFSRLDLDRYWEYRTKSHVYPEHNEEYYKECLDNLAIKGINLGENLVRAEQ